MRYSRLTFWTLVVTVLLIWPLAYVSFAAPEFGRESRWRGREFTISLSESLQNGGPNINGDLQGALRSSIALWATAADIRILVTDTDLDSVNPPGLRGDGTSLLTGAGTAANLKLFPDLERSAPATTRVFRGKDGFITEADIVLNPFVQFSDNAAPGTYDLQAVLTHEIGHFLGLSHSPSLSSVMYEKTGRNFNRSMRPGLVLSWADRAAVRDLYGVRAADLTCCGTVAGRAYLAQGRTWSVVWAEDAVSGRLAAVTLADRDGSFKLGGIEQGTYRVFVQTDANDSTAAMIGEFEITADRLISVRAVKGRSEKVGGVEYIGIDGRMFSLPVIIGAGQTAELYAGGRTFEPVSSGVGLSGDGFVVTVLSGDPLEYARDILAKVFQVAVDRSVETGEYNLFTQGPSGGRHYLLGAIAVR